MRRRSRSLPYLAGLGLITAGLVTTLPLGAQTGSTWHDQKINDMRAHERGKLASTEAGREYDLAVGYLHRMQSLLDDKDRGERQEKKLQKSYEKAVAHLEKAIEAADDWLDPRMMLGAAHYKMKEYQAAKDAYEGVLALEPENESAKSYLASVNWYLTRSQAADAGGS